MVSFNLHKTTTKISVQTYSEVSAVLLVSFVVCRIICTRFRNNFHPVVI